MQLLPKIRTQHCRMQTKTTRQSKQTTKHREQIKSFQNLHNKNIHSKNSSEKSISK